MGSIGGVVAGQGNVIANMTGDGIRIEWNNSNHSYPAAFAIRGNAIYNNGGMGIDLADSVTPSGDGVPNVNDTGDLDTGPNNFQNFPVPTSASTNGASTTVNLALDTYALGSFWVDVYASPTCDANGHGEGRVYLGTSNVNTDGSGQANVTISGLPATTAGHFITLTATDTVQQSTSEFSVCRAITATSAATAAHQVPVFGLLGQLLASLLLGLGGLFMRRGR